MPRPRGHGGFSKSEEPCEYGGFSISENNLTVAIRIKEAESALKRKPTGRPKNMRLPENIAAVRTSSKQYSTCSAVDILKRSMKNI